MKKPIITAALMLLVPTAGFSQEVSGHLTVGAQVVDTSPNSSKFNEYRDIKDGFYLYDLGLLAETGTGYFLGATGRNVGRDDQNLRLEGGSYGRWGVNLEWDEIIHRLSNKAQTPYINQGGGLYTVPATVTGITRHLAPTAAQQQANDLQTAAYMAANARPVELGNDRKKASAGLNVALIENLKLRLTVSNEDRDGNKISYGPIGDRPPRSLNIQFEEPINYRTQEAKLEADYTGKFYQANFTYLVSKFENKTDTLTWQNIYNDPAASDPTGTFQTWNDGRQVANFGRRALPQDNLYQNAGLTLGVNLPLNSRLTATASYGLAEQDETLIPYSTNGRVDSVAAGDGLAWNDPAKLPRNTADAEIETKLFNLDYSINPIQRLNLRAYYRYYDLANNTPTEQWRYVTGDTTGATGGVDYVNKRRNLAYEYDKQNYGVDANYSLPIWASTLGLGYGREEIDREFREANTDENSYRVSLRSRPTNWVSFRTKYQYGDRQADNYNGEAAHSTYWYAPGEATPVTAGGGIDSQFTFENHPDTRRFDVTDRERNQFDFQVTMSPVETVDVSASYRYRKDDYDSKVQPSQPLARYAGVLAFDQFATTPGDQVGLLKDKREFYGLDVAYTPTQRLRFGAFASRDEANTLQRGFEFNENFKSNPSGIPDTTNFGPWTRESMQWTGDIKDTTYTVGVNTEFDIIPKKLNFTTNYAFSMGKVEIDYAGFGAQTSLTPPTTLADNHEFAFRTPPAVRNNRHTFNATLAYEVMKDLTAALSYMYEYYKIKDWQQEANTPWGESVAGNELMLRDTSASNQWGNRLPNLGSNLAPSYQSHVVSLGVTYKF
jgi:MtrB/PioB family decaheme-associated outer membrane protein